MIDHVWVFKFMYMIVNGNNQHLIYKVSGNPRTGLITSSGSLAVNVYTAISFDSTWTHRSMQSLE
jgi:hypothetical protein